MTADAYASWKDDMLAGKVTLMAGAGNADVTNCLPRHGRTKSSPGRSKVLAQSLGPAARPASLTLAFLPSLRDQD
jgi:hypothetical protein